MRVGGGAVRPRRRSSPCPPPGQGHALYSAVAVASVAVHPDRRPHPSADRSASAWYLLAVGTLAFAGGDSFEHFTGHVPHAGTVRAHLDQRLLSGRVPPDRSGGGEAQPRSQPVRAPGGLRRRRHHLARGAGHPVAVPAQLVPPRRCADHVREAGRSCPTRSWTSSWCSSCSASLIFGVAGRIFLRLLAAALVVLVAADVGHELLVVHADPGQRQVRRRRLPPGLRADRRGRPPSVHRRGATHPPEAGAQHLPEGLEGKPPHPRRGLCRIHRPQPAAGGQPARSLGRRHRHGRPSASPSSPSSTSG